MVTGGAVGGQPTWWCWQHQSLFQAPQVGMAPTAQLGSTGPGGGGGRVIGGVGGGVGGSVGGWVSGKAVEGMVVHPLPVVMQQ